MPAGRNSHERNPPPPSLPSRLPGLRGVAWVRLGRRVRASGAHAATRTVPPSDLWFRRPRGLGGEGIVRGLPHVTLLLVVLGCLTGCSDASKRKWRPRSAQTNYRNALESEESDLRRDAVARIAEARYFDSEGAFAVLDVVARTDPVEQIRCIAVRAFGRYEDDRPVAPLLVILQAEPGSPDALALAPGTNVRWDAASVLADLAGKGLVTGEQRDAARQLFIQMAEGPSSREVRIVATEALGDFQDREVFEPLIGCLRGQDEFAIAERAEHALIRLTGVTQEYDPDAWEAWLAGTDEPFAHAGRVPQTTRPAGPSWWDRQQRAWRRGLKLNTE